MTSRISSDERFRKEEHILKTGDFAVVYKKARSVKIGSLILYNLPNKFGYSRLGLSISSKFVKLATSRSRIRRVLREIFRKNKKNLTAGFDMVFVVKKDLARELSYKETEDIFLKLAQRAGVVK